MRTPWGYEVSDTIDPIISLTEFHQMTGNAYVSNPRVGAALIAASQAIRNYCGWHICPSLKCTAYPVGGGLVAKLPAGYVSAVSKVTEDDIELDAGLYQWRKDGLIRKNASRLWSDDWDSIEVEYTAGYDTAAVPDLIEAVCSITMGVLSVTAGVMSESADGVSISYNNSASSVAASLTTARKSALEPYKVVSSHAA